MSGARLPTVRLPTVVAGQGVDEERLGQDSAVVELPPSKFGISLSSSEGETDVSEEEFNPPARRAPRSGEGDDSEFVTPTKHLNSDQNPLDRPLLSLQNPRRTPSGDKSPPTIIELPPEYGHFHELSLELADSVQMVIQTLLQLSPPQVLDPVKEQFSACSLSIPTPSISAMFTSMKNLNYMSANMSTLSLDSFAQNTPEGIKTLQPQPSVVWTDFDVGEMLQSVGDALSGVAAQSGVDLVLFHHDLGLKHVAVRGDESGISYTLSHVIRQIIGTASRGDAIEIGLFVEGTQSVTTPSPNTDDDPAADSSVSPAPSPMSDPAGPLRCKFHIAHRFSATEVEEVDSPETSASSSLPFMRPEPSFSSLLLRRLLRHVNASLETDVHTKHPFPGRPYELTMTLERGLPSVVDPVVNLPPEDAASLGYPDFRIAQEPTLEQLNQFAESMRGKKATLFANPDGSFAHHLTSYLTAWGLDVSHMPADSQTGGSSEPAERSPEVAMSSVLVREDIPSLGLSEQVPTVPSYSGGTPTTANSLSFILIDDDVAVLHSRLQTLKAELAYPLTINPRKRPSLAANHRPRSSPQVARVMGLTSATVPAASQVVVVHFTSLSNFKLVKDAIQSVLAPGSNTSSRVPEVIVIPKPAGPRRVLTALHTAFTKPIVDPYFAPIATSPISPGFHSPFFNMDLPKSPGGRSTASMRTASDRTARSPKETFGDTSSATSSSPRGVPDGMEYFSDAAAKLGTSPASGLIIQSPDGQPTGIFFQPKAKGARNVPSLNAERERGQYVQSSQRTRGGSFRRGSGGDETAIKMGALTMTPQEIVRRSPRNAINVDISDRQTSDAAAGARRWPPAVGEDPPPLSIGQSSAGPSSGVPTLDEQSRSQTVPRVPTRKATAPDPPTSPLRSPTTPTTRRGARRPAVEAIVSAPAVVQKKGNRYADGSIVPPISVLIVEDNPINQTILSTFMTRKGIKYDVAKNGEEAVQKWRSGGFHLILMDIQMPVMDGIQATKEIRRIEKLNGAPGFPSTPQSEGQQTPSDTSTTDRSALTPPYRSSVIIVALTASSLQTDRVAALAAGCNDFLTKPVSLHWLNSKIIEWGSIKALQMWADIRPDVVKSISTGQAAQAQNVARRLHVPEGRSTPSRSRSPSTTAIFSRKQGSSVELPPMDRDKTITPNTPLHEESLGVSSRSSPESANVHPPFFSQKRTLVQPVTTLETATAGQPQTPAQAYQSAGGELPSADDEPSLAPSPSPGDRTTDVVAASRDLDKFSDAESMSESVGATPPTDVPPSSGDDSQAPPPPTPPLPQ
ncbi:hypothetical protein SCP_0205480 [Sparassis crispa]|uniref:Response regulatory domain-containing protein n=1 Tax=Sparassis crispa TaxID=139825 RepID=A0A401GAZ7_9APHY|nr:hypothetical protein SCP_0205480 [Sparassis crispa]GBE79350.1 hypothetical protein SCP_0205480 [Sparassis crispa]